MRYGSKVLFEDVTTTFARERRYGLTGPNGGGKSTFMKLLTGELEPQRGRMQVSGQPGQLRVPLSLARPVFAGFVEGQALMAVRTLLCAAWREALRAGGVM